MNLSPAAANVIPPTSTAVAAAPPTAAPKGVVAEARAAMTPETSELISDAALGFRIGRGTFAGAIGDSVRFRVVGDGPMASRQIIPDSPAAQAVLQSRHGAKLLTQLHVAANSIAGLEGKENLSVIVLPKDVDGTVAASLLGSAEAGNFMSRIQLQAMSEPGASSSPFLREHFQGERERVNGMYRKGVAAWNQSGTIIFRPDVARMMLTAAGAFKPGEGASRVALSAKLGAQFVNHIPTHEVQHSATPVGGAFYSSPAKWMEEAVAQVLSATPAVLRRTETATGVTAQSYAGHMAHEPKVDLGWGDWKAQPRSAAEEADNKQQVGRNYARSQDVMRSLLTMSGFSWRSSVQLERTKQFLQGEPVETLADRLAATLAEKFSVPADRVDELATRITTVIDDEGGLAQLKDDFGLR